MIRKILKKISRNADAKLTRVLLKNIKPVDIHNSEYIFIFHQIESKFTTRLYILVAHELSKLGIASCFKYHDDLLSRNFPRFEIDGVDISNSFKIDNRFYIKSLHDRQPFFKWQVEIENEKIEAEGINFFPLIRNTLRTMQKRYNIFFKDEENRPVYNELIQSCDLLLKYFLLLKNYSKKYNKKIRLIGFEAAYVPNGTLKMLCDQQSHNRDIEYIDLGRGYMYYFGQYHPKESYISYSNLTQTKESFSYVISKEQFETLNINKIDANELLKPVSNAVKKNSWHKTPDNQKQVIKKIEKFKSKGKKVFVLFAHLFYDTHVFDETPAFSGMCEWISETINYFNGKENLLLIKPHPAEFLPEQPQKAPDETLASFLSDTELPENIILLDPHQYTTKDLSPYISCGLIWRSSVAMELTFLGIPCIIAGNPLYNALNLVLAKDKAHYFELIEKSHKLTVTEKLKTDVAAYQYLLEKNHVHIDCISYTKLRKFHWNRKALRKYLKKGNENIKSIADSMLS
jgi:hypothetical protein